MKKLLVFPLMLGCIAFALVAFSAALPGTLSPAGAETAIVGP